jgi:hypothetical protein
MQDEDERDRDQETVNSDPFAIIDELDSPAAFRAWELQTHAIAAIGELYLKLIEVSSPSADETTRAIGNALVDLIEDWKPRNIAIMASAIAAGSPGEPDK